MRYHILRFDIWLCLLLSVLLSLIPANILKKTLPEKYEDYKEEHKVDVGNIGGKADENTYRAQNIEDLLTHDTFTIVSKGIEYKNRGSGYYKGMYLHAVTLPSGERVAARINSDSVTTDGDSIYTGNSTLPVGKIIKEDLTKEETFINQIEFKEPLTTTDLYIDMVGEAEIQSEEYYIETPIMLSQIITVIIAFPLFHMIGSKLGIFPYIIAPRKKRESEWE